MFVNVENRHDASSSNTGQGFFCISHSAVTFKKSMPPIILGKLYGQIIEKIKLINPCNATG